MRKRLRSLEAKIKQIKALPGLEKLVKQYQRLNRDRPTVTIKVCGADIEFELKWESGYDVTVRPVYFGEYPEDYSNTFWKKYHFSHQALVRGEDKLAEAISKFSNEIAEYDRTIRAYAKQHKVNHSDLFDVVWDESH